ncbi:Sulfite exporter TauE/SafE [Hartmannibacter diazotrophicus]|uniref:Probable membrane transporter protein n=1 Tax=Hartmannibacter diazotrophicus TaxID=1482074 RepID=A0A2C9D3D8_9HYPH|nr:sulfite exporter TauE/SafE family protein [Hartmannibacter diazotrophicus]SON53985.1 Sulfite exporter TauE/SafE [Hartmannibacter diazotrophicus]
MPLTQALLATGSGGLVGLVLGLIGGGGSVLAVPLLVYVVGVSSPHVAIGTSAVAVAVSAFSNLLTHWREGHVKWRCAAVFTATGIVGAYLGSTLGKAVDGGRLLALFGALMIAIGLLMLKKRGEEGDANVRLTTETAPKLLPMLVLIGLTVGAFSGFFGIGGGFLIVPGLILATRMSLPYAIGTSLVAVTAFGATTATNYAASGLVDWPLVALFVGGGLFGGFGGVALGKTLSNGKKTLGTVFAAIVIVVGVYVVIRGVAG